MPETKPNCSSINLLTPPLVTNLTLKFATFNLFNYLEPPAACYDFDRIYSIEQWHKKQNWISAYLQEQQPDVIGFQEVFSPESLRELVARQGYRYFEVVDQAEVHDEFIYRSPVVAIASRFPIVAVAAVQPDKDLAQCIGLSDDFNFSRKVLRATVDLPHIGQCDCYVVHFKSKRPVIEHENSRELNAEQNIIEKLKNQIAGGWGSSVQRGSEAALLLVEMIKRRAVKGLPMILLGDFNNQLNDGILEHLLTDTLRFVSKFDSDAYLNKYILKDGWDLYQTTINGQANITRPATHYYGAVGSVLDYILLSCEFDPNYQASLFELSDYHTYERHLINPIFARDSESTDHGIVMVTLTLRS